MEMITSSDIILELILQKGYRGLNDFATKNRIDSHHLYHLYRNNKWSAHTLDKLSKILRKDLRYLTTVNNKVDK